MAAIAIQHREQILQSIAAGQRLTDIAASLGLKTHSAIVNRLGNDPEYIIARETGAEARLEARERDLEGAMESVTVARADKLLGHARWRCEREFPHRWGAKQQLTVEHRVTVDERLAGDLASLLGRVVDTQQAGRSEVECEGTDVMSNPALPSPVANAQHKP
mgnify:CR=1 FL=1